MSETLSYSGELLKLYRRAEGLTQAELAAKAGVSPGYVSQLERGERAGGVKGWRKLAAALNQPLVNFMPQVIAVAEAS